jgi:hypothetical protein
VLDQYGGPPPLELMGSRRHSSRYSSHIPSIHGSDRVDTMLRGSPDSNPMMFGNYAGSARSGMRGSHYGPHAHPTPGPRSVRRSPELDRDEFGHPDFRGPPSLVKPPLRG